MANSTTSHEDLEASVIVHNDSEDTITVTEAKVADREETVEEKPLVYDKGYCWVVCLSAFIMNGCTWGMNTAFSVYFSYYLNNNTFPGASKLDYSAVGGLAFGATIMFTPFINYLQGWIGVKNTIIVGNCLQFTALMLASFTKKLWQLYLTQGLLQSAGLALISIPSITILPQFFKKKRILSSSIATSGSGVFGIAFNLGMQKIVEIRDPFWALRAQAIISFVMVWIAIILFKSRDKHHKVEFTFFDFAVFKLYGFWFVGFYIVFCMFGYVVTLYTIVNYTTSLGYTSYQGSIAAAMIQLGSFLGRPVVGYLADIFGGTTVAASCYFLSGVFCLAMWIPARNYATVLIFCLIIGAIMGTIFGTIAPILTRLVGIRKMNIAFSMLWTLLGSSSIVSPIIGVTLVKGTAGEVDPTQYLYCIVFAGLGFICCSLCLFLLRGYILARDQILESQYSKLELAMMELDSSTLVSTAVPVPQTIKHSLRLMTKV